MVIRYQVFGRYIYEWDNSTDCDEKEGPCCRITNAEVKKALESMKKGKAAGQSRVVTEILQAQTMLELNR